MKTIQIEYREADVILAALRLLQREIEAGAVSPNDGDIGNIMTNDGLHSGMTVEEIDALIEEKIN